MWGYTGRESKCSEPVDVGSRGPLHRTTDTRTSSSSFSFAARCASHACSSGCATLSLDDDRPGEVKELREICDVSPPDEPSERMKESRVGFWFLESLMRRVTLSPKICR